MNRTGEYAPVHSWGVHCSCGRYFSVWISKHHAGNRKDCDGCGTVHIFGDYKQSTAAALLRAIEPGTPVVRHGRDL